MTSIEKKYNVLYEMLVVSKGVHVNQIKDFLVSLSIDDFNRIVIKIMESNDQNLFLQIVYYLRLFRNVEDIKVLLNNKELSLEVLEKFLIFTFAQASLNNVSEEEALENVLIFVNQDKYLDLLLNSELIAIDKLLSYFLMTKLNRKSIDFFFNNHPDIIGFLEGFLKLPDRTIKVILTKNPDLFGYISLFLQALDNENSREFSDKFAREINEVEEIKKIILDISKHYDLEKEKHLNLSERNLKRLAEIISRIKNMNNVFNFLYTLENEGVLFDSIERSLINEILENPLFKDVLYKFTYGIYSKSDDNF